MPLHTTEAYVLRTYTLAEADKICVFLTKDCGKVRGVAHGARKMKSRFGSSLEPFTEVSVTYFYKEGRELVSVSNCDIVRSSFHMASRDVETASALSYMAELVTEFLPDHEPNEKLYRLVSAALESIDEENDLLMVLRYFEAWLLKLMGFFPDLSQCSVCHDQIGQNNSAFLTVQGAPRCHNCSGGRGEVADSEMRRLVDEMFHTHPRQFAKRKISEKRLAQMGEINYQIIRQALERDLRSRFLLKELAQM